MLLSATAAAQPLPQATSIAAKAVLLLSTTSSTAAQGGCPSPTGTTAPSKVTAAEKDTILRIHNQARAATNGAPALSPLAWDSSLANGAQGWADVIGPSSHSECHSGSWASGQGENIADFGTVEAGVQYWYNEKARYTYPTPVAAGTPYLHYTQMVWRVTQRIGCGKAPSAKYWPGNIALVCRYSPAGNFWGRAPY
ncbi:MAG: CAP domain-containing protein [Actinomycetota bacterium]|nr:CAP domain-containing protein [Actinomycetota bacterium]